MAGRSFLAGRLTSGATARRCICTFPASTATCGMSRRSKAPKRNHPVRFADQAVFMGCILIVGLVRSALG